MAIRLSLNLGLIQPKITNWMNTYLSPHSPSFLTSRANWIDFKQWGGIENQLLWGFLTFKLVFFAVFFECTTNSMAHVPCITWKLYVRMLFWGSISNRVSKQWDWRHLPADAATNSISPIVYVRGTTGEMQCALRKSGVAASRVRLSSISAG